MGFSVSADLARLLKETETREDEEIKEDEERVPAYNPFAAALAPGPPVKQQSTVDTVGSMPVPMSIDIGTGKRRRSSSLTSTTKSTPSTPATPSSPISGSHSALDLVDRDLAMGVGFEEAEDVAPLQMQSTKRSVEVLRKQSSEMLHNGKQSPASKRPDGVDERVEQRYEIEEEEEGPSQGRSGCDSCCVVM